MELVVVDNGGNVGKRFEGDGLRCPTVPSVDKIQNNGEGLGVPFRGVD